MAVVHLKIHARIEAGGRLRLDVPTQFPAGDAEVDVTIRAENGDQNPRYDFSDIAGRLAWRGDAIARQRELRDDW